MSPSEEWLERSGDGSKKGEEDETVLSFSSEMGWVGGDDVSNGDFGFRTDVGAMDEAMKIIAFKKCADLKAPCDVIICGEFGL